MVVIIVTTISHQNLADQCQTMVIFAMIIALQTHLTQIVPLLQEIIVRKAWALPILSLQPHKASGLGLMMARVYYTALIHH